MLHNVSIANATEQIAKEGLTHLYRGVLPPLMQKSISLSIMFGMYDECRRPLVENGVPLFWAKIVAAISAGTFESILVPFERTQTLLQHEKYHRALVNMRHAMGFMLKRHGLVELYRGLVPILFRNGPSNAMFFLLRDEAQVRIPEPHTIPGRIAKQFAIGALTGALCSTTFYPCNVLKVHMQSTIGGPFQSIPSAVKEIYEERQSIRGFFRGVHLNYTRSCISWGVINVAYEAIRRTIGS